jgi:hypothetical protein
MLWCFLAGLDSPRRFGSFMNLFRVTGLDNDWSVERVSKLGHGSPDHITPASRWCCRGAADFAGVLLISSGGRDHSSPFGEVTQHAFDETLPERAVVNDNRVNEANTLTVQCEACPSELLQRRCRDILKRRAQEFLSNATKESSEPAQNN